ncbi:MAG: C1 family peptidase, partial [Planctomycetota bacterium]
MKDSLIYRIALACQLIVTLTASSLLGAEGALSVAIIEQFRSGCQMDAHTRAMYNAITNNDIRELALNREVLKHHNEIFSHKVETKGVTDQKKSGRCWLFAGLNVMRPAVIKKYNLESFEFSQSYLSFWDKLEKANTFLERIIEFRERDVLDRGMELILRQPISDGGYWENVVDLIGKHGVVPKDIMPETNSSENTYQMNRVIGQKLRSDAVKLRKMAEGKEAVEKLRATKNKMLAETYRML